DALLESTSSKLYEEISSQVLEGSGNPNPTASAFNSLADQMETLTVESPISTMDVKSAFLYGTIDKEVYVMQPLGFHDPVYPAKVYKVEKSMYGLHQAPRAWYDVISSNTPMDKKNPWGKDGPGKDVELHLYRSMIGSLMYLTASRPDIMFAVRACARHQVTPKECHLHAVKRIF
nr:hypothetical protein [Tanacetum cinerariifolium]